MLLIKVLRNNRRPKDGKHYTLSKALFKQRVFLFRGYATVVTKQNAVNPCTRNSCFLFVETVSNVASELCGQAILLSRIFSEVIPTVGPGDQSVRCPFCYLILADN